MTRLLDVETVKYILNIYKYRVLRLFRLFRLLDWSLKECSIRRSVLTDLLRTAYQSLIKLLKIETEKLVILRSRLFIYTGRGSTGKFKFNFVWRLYVAVTLFRPEFVYYYITYILTMLILRGKTTTWFELSSSSCVATHCLLRQENHLLLFKIKLLFSPSK